MKKCFIFIMLLNFIYAMDTGEKFNMLFKIFNDSMSKKNNYKFNNLDGSGTHGADIDSLKQKAENPPNQAKEVLNSANPEKAYNNSQNQFNEIVQGSKEKMQEAQVK